MTHRWVVFKVPPPPEGQRWTGLELLTREPGELTWVLHSTIPLDRLWPGSCDTGCERTSYQRDLSETAEIAAEMVLGEDRSPISNVMPVQVYRRSRDNAFAACAKADLNDNGAPGDGIDVMLCGVGIPTYGQPSGLPD